MPKYIVRVECNRIRWIKVKKAERDLIGLGNRLYSNEDKLYLPDLHSSDAIRITPIDSNNAAGFYSESKSVNPDTVRAKIMSAEIGGTKKKSILNFDASKLWQYLTAIIVVGAIVYGLLASGTILG